MCEFDHSRPTGTRVVGVTQFGATLLSLFCLFRGDYSTSFFSTTEWFIVVAFLGLTALNLLVSLLLLLATVVPRKICLLRTWLAWEAICVFYLVASTIVVVILDANGKYLSWGRGWDMCTLNSISLLIQCLFIYIVLNYYEHLLSQQKEEGEEGKKKEMPVENEV